MEDLLYKCLLIVIVILLIVIIIQQSIIRKRTSELGLFDQYDDGPQSCPQPTQAPQPSAPFYEHYEQTNLSTENIVPSYNSAAPRKRNIAEELAMIPPKPIPKDAAYDRPDEEETNTSHINKYIIYSKEKPTAIDISKETTHEVVQQDDIGKEMQNLKQAWQKTIPTGKREF
jgi:hypothetical protein